MKILRLTIFSLFLVAGLSLSASAQKNDQKKPKPPPPVVVPGGDKKPPKNNPPRGDDRPKKPEYSWFIAMRSSGADLA